MPLSRKLWFLLITLIGLVILQQKIILPRFSTTSNNSDSFSSKKNKEEEASIFLPPQPQPSQSQPQQETHNNINKKHYYNDDDDDGIINQKNNQSISISNKHARQQQQSETEAIIRTRLNSITKSHNIYNGGGKNARVSKNPNNHIPPMNNNGMMIPPGNNNTTKTTHKNIASTAAVRPPPWKTLGGKGGGGGIPHQFMKKPYLHQGYKPTGGKLPLDVAEFLIDPGMWRFVDNRKCLTTAEPGDIRDATNQQEEEEGYSTAAATATTPTLERRGYYHDWQKRAPYAILIGVMKGGTHAVTESLWEHPYVAPTNHWELHFYDNGNLAIRTDKGIYQRISRRNYANLFLKSLPSDFLNASSKMIAIDASPRYILSSDRIPDAMFCITPWAKLLAIVRNPIDRASSQYRYLDETRRKYDKPMVDWSTWIIDDIRLLNEAGVLNATTPIEEKLAWKKYQRRPNSNQIVGRGLYVIQIEQYLEAMDRVNKSRSDLLVIQSEEFRSKTQVEYNKILQFLNLPSHQLSNVTDVHVTTNKKYSKPMPNSIRILLQDLYRPYNQRLYKLLGWDNVWD